MVYGRLRALLSRVLAVFRASFTSILLTALVFLHSAAAFTMQVDLQCQQCNASFYCTGGERFQCPEDSVANAWPAANITDCTCNNGFKATPQRDACEVGQPPFYYEAGHAKSCAGGLRQTIYPLADSAFSCVCPPGYYGPPGLGACTKCAPGSYAELFNTSECAPCAAFSFSQEGSSLRSECICNAGYSGQDGGPCAACAAGEYKGAPGSAACVQCDADTYAAPAAAACTPCRHNSSAPAGSSSEDAHH